MYELVRPPFCSVGRAMDILGERWTMLIMREAFYGVRRFSDMQRNLGMARNILSAGLQPLVRLGILEGRRSQEEPERFKSRLSQAGRDLYPAVIAIMKWGDEYLAEEAGPPVVLRHSCGELIAPVLVCDHCREPLHPHDVTPEPGPGAQVPTPS